MAAFCLAVESIYAILSLEQNTMIHMMPPLTRTHTHTHICHSKYKFMKNVICLVHRYELFMDTEK